MSTVTIDHLNHLITIAEDGAQGYQTASEDAKNDSLKSLLSKYAGQRSTYSLELKAIVSSLGEEPSEDGGPIGALHRGWIEIKSWFAAEDNKSVIQECIRGEEAALNAYDKALADITTTENYYDTVKKQRDGVSIALQEMKALELTLQN